MTRALALEAPQIVADGAGGFVTTWAVLGTVWADVALRSGRAARGGAGVIGDAGYRITLRAAPVGSEGRPQAGQRFRDGTRVFRIEAVAEADALGRNLTCFASEEVAA
nr:head-tail adaptor protein [Mesobacterium sp. TK19101]